VGTKAPPFACHATVSVCWAKLLRLAKLRPVHRVVSQAKLKVVVDDAAGLEAVLEHEDVLRKGIREHLHVLRENATHDLACGGHDDPAAPKGHTVGRLHGDHQSLPKELRV
jgi:hypothetical protein